MNTTIKGEISMEFNILIPGLNSVASRHTSNFSCTENILNIVSYSQNTRKITSNSMFTS